VTSLEVLKKIIIRAEQNGWKKKQWEQSTKISLDNDLELLLKPYHIFILIFSKDFLKSFFHKQCKACRGNWQNHQLRIMIAIQKQSNILNYFKKFIKE